MPYKSHTLKITGVPEDLVRLLDSRIKERHSVGRSEYLRELIRKDVLEKPKTLNEILAPVHSATRKMKESEVELDILFDQARDEVYQDKNNK